MNRSRNALKSNVFWFIASFAMAFLVWLVATTQANPIEERTFFQIPVQLVPDEGLMIVGQPTRNVRVNVRAQKSVLDVLQSEEIVVLADLGDLGAGSHTVDLDVDIARRADADPQPKRITVTLEEVRMQQVQIVAGIESAPPPGYERSDPVFSDTQALISGPASLVQTVVAARAEIDLTELRDTLDIDVRLTPVDAEGESVDDVTVDPQTVGVLVEITRRDDVREVSVSPNIDASTLPEGFLLASIRYEPQAVLVIGTPDELAAIPDTIFTELIDLTDRTEDFDVVVPVVFPDEELPQLGEQAITVSVQIIEQTTTRQFEDVPVEIIGMDALLVSDITPADVTVLLTGPQTTLETLGAEDILVVIDVNGLPAGTYDLIPQVSTPQLDIGADNIAVLPNAINVRLAAVTDTSDNDAS